MSITLWIWFLTIMRCTWTVQHFFLQIIRYSGERSVVSLFIWFHSTNKIKTDCSNINQILVKIMLNLVIVYLFLWIICHKQFQEPSWSHGSWIYKYLCIQCLSPLALWGRTSLRRDVVDITLCDKVCQWLAAGLWFSQSTLVSSTNLTEIWLKVVFNTIIITHKQFHNILSLGSLDMKGNFLLGGKTILSFELNIFFS